MRYILLATGVLFFFRLDAQINQNVGLSELEITYSRPSKRGRQVFGNVVPYDEMWRLGANKNSRVMIGPGVVVNPDVFLKDSHGPDQ